MARLDVQLDKLSGEKLVEIAWPEDGSVDISALRSALISEIDTHTHRIPLDLRGVRGAPPELVQLLVEMRQYARSRSKTLSTTWILPPLRMAIEKQIHLPAGSTVAPLADLNGEAASKSADELLRGVEKKSEYDLSKAKKIERKRKRASNRRRRYLKLVAIIVAATIVVGTAEVIYLFNENEDVLIPQKGFE